MKELPSPSGLNFIISKIALTQVHVISQNLRISHVKEYVCNVNFGVLGLNISNTIQLLHREPGRNPYLINYNTAE